MRTKKRMLALVLLVSVFLTSIPVTAQTGGGLCSHHTEHTEDCGYDADAGATCNYICGECNGEEKKDEPADTPKEEKKDEPADTPKEEKKDEAADTPEEEKKDEPADTPKEEKKEEPADTPEEGDGGIMPLSVDCTHESFDEYGFCTTTAGCGFYKPAEKNSEGKYEIWNAGQLYWFAAFVNGDNTYAVFDEQEPKANAVLKEDIELNPGYTFKEDGTYTEGGVPRSWTPIGNYSNNYSSYTGTFDGDGHTISGVYIKSEQNYQGLFGQIGYDGKVEKTGLVNSYIAGNSYVGGIAGELDTKGSINDCYHSGIVSTSGYSSYTGGIAGQVWSGNITNCYNNGTVRGDSSNRYIGGIIGRFYLGYNGGIISNTYYLPEKVTSGKGIGDGSGSAVGKTEDQFASGEVAYLLNGSRNGDGLIWYQTVGGDSYPVFDSSHSTVYRHYPEDNPCFPTYDNTPNNGDDIEPGHVYVNGFCTSSCGFYQPADLKDGKYEIENAGQLYWFAALVNGDSTHAELDQQKSNASAVLTEDIDLNPEYIFNENGDAEGGSGELRSWTPIGSKSNAYTGTFDGNGHTISGVYIKSDQDYQGLFGYIGSGGNVSKTGLLNSYIAGYDYIGGITGWLNSGNISDCYHSGSVSTSGYSSYIYIGGIAGRVQQNGSIINCYNNGTVSGASSSNVNPGGIVGNVDSGSVKNTYYLAEKVKNGKGIGSGSGTAIAKTEEQFASGEVTYLLNDDRKGDMTIWYQNIDESEGKKKDDYPVLDASHSKVYRHYYEGNSCTAVYDNFEKQEGELDSPEHNFVDGFCINSCGFYEPANLNDGKYEIKNIGQLYWFAALVNGDKMHAEFTEKNSGANAVLKANINLNPGYTFNENGVDEKGSSDLRSWTPIGSEGSYTGVFDGDGYTISGVYIKNNESNQGLFGVIGSGGQVVKTGLVDSYIAGGNYVGGIAGKVDSNGSISNCYNNGTVSTSGYSSYTGGIAGQVWSGSISNCYNNGTIRGNSSNSNIGGIAGEVFYGSADNNYYLADQVTNGKGIGSGSGSAVGKTEEQFASGEVAYLLNGKQEEPVIWYQNIDEIEGEKKDDSPVLDASHSEVYLHYYEENPCIAVYNNDSEKQGGEKDSPEHDFEDGFCISGCGFYEPAGKNSEGKYEIWKAGQLYWFAALVNGDNEHAEFTEKESSASAVLKENIDLNPGYTFNEDGTYTGGDTPRNWTPIGSGGNIYTGMFDGAGHTISGLYINSAENNQGLFGRVGDWGTSIEINNVGVVNSYITGNGNVGGIAGSISGTVISNCYHRGTIKATGARVGGIAGEAGYGGGISNSYHSGIVTTSNSGSDPYIGGIMGYMSDKDIINSYYEADQVLGDKGIGYDTSGTYGVLAEASSKTKDQFASGEVTYLLNNENKEDTKVWRQKLDGDKKDDYPFLNLGDDEDDIVYLHYYKATACVAVYDNTPNGDGELETLTHIYEDGICKACGKYVKAEYDESNNVYEIENAGQLYWFAALVNGDNTHAEFEKKNAAANAVLTKDIDLNPEYTFDENGVAEEGTGKLRSWTPIGNVEEYVGDFNGAGHTISGVYIQSHKDNQGLFGKVGNSNSNNKLTNLGVVNSYITGNNRVGGIAGYIQNTEISDIYYTGIVKADGESARVGGIAGESDHGSIIRSYHTGSISSSGTDAKVGGVVGYAYYGSIKGSYHTGTVNADGENTRVGGIAGEVNYESIISNSYHIGTVNADGENARVGGIAGYVYYGSIKSSHHTGTVNADGENAHVGGIAGDASYGGSIINSYYEKDQVTGGKGIGLGSGEAVGKTKDQFASGEVTYLLNSNNDDENAADWRQNLETDEKDPYPVLDESHKKVYRHYDEEKTCIALYNNIEPLEEQKPVHKYDNGFCSNGCGTYEPAELDGDTYKIGNAGQLYWFAALVNGDRTHAEFKQQTSDAKAVLIKDIKLNPGYTFDENGVDKKGSGELRSWTPIGSNENPYTGDFDGDGHTISGVYIQSQKDNQGLFGKFGEYYSYNKLTNLGVVNSYITGNNRVGGIAGNIQYAEISDIYYMGTVKADGEDAYVGGIAGEFSEGSIIRSYHTGTVNADGKSARVGGIAGYASYYENIINSYHTGRISASGEFANVGGIVGYNSSGSISNSYHTGRISASGESANVGGIAGYVSYASIINSYYEKEQVTGGKGIGHKYGNEVAEVFPKTKDQFTSGEVAYLLNSNDDENAFNWRQNLETAEKDPYPVLDKSHKKVYLHYDEEKPCIALYNNTKNEQGEVLIPEHDFDDKGFCKRGCGTYEPIEPEEGTYKIGNAGQLYWFAALVNGDKTHAEFEQQNSAANAVLTADIDLNPGYTFNENGVDKKGSGELRSWTPIGNNEYPYTGKFDGSGHLISGVYINSEESNQGLFGCVSSNGINNLGVVNSYIAGNNRVGGIVGDIQYAEISDIYYMGTVKSDGEDVNVGGIAGLANRGSIIRNSYHVGSVSASGTFVCAGGIAGYVASGSIRNSYHVGSVNASGETTYVGGIAGNSFGSLINNYYEKEQVTGGKGIGSGSGETVGKTKDQFASGEVAYLLNSNDVDNASDWRQNLETAEKDPYPVLDKNHNKVYRHYDEEKTCIARYDNTKNEEGERLEAVHDYDDKGFCKNGCGTYQPIEPEEGTYKIGNAGQLYWFAALVNGDKTHAEFEQQNSNVNAVLTADIDLNPGYIFDENGVAKEGSGDLRSWMPIGNNENLYTGKFDGGGHSISGLYVDSEESNQGLFGRVGIYGIDTKINDLGVVNSYITGNDCVGGIAGYIVYTEISNSYHVGTVKADGENGIAGGIVGRAYFSSISNSYHTGSVSASGEQSNVGGIAGEVANQSSISNTYFEKGQVPDDKGIGSGSGEAFPKTKDQFASGEVAHLLQRGQADPAVLVWGQDLTSDKADDLPVLTTKNGMKVVKIEVKQKEDASFKDFAVCYINWNQTLLRYPSIVGKNCAFYEDEACTEQSWIETDTKAYTEDTTIYAVAVEAPSYTVTIPAEVELNKDKPMTIKAEDVSIVEEKALKVGVEPNQEFKLVNKDNAEISVMYTVEKETAAGSEQWENVSSGDNILTVDGGIEDNSGSVNLRFVPSAEAVKYSGTYKGKIQFVVGLQGVE